MATVRGRPRNTGKAGNKEESKNTLERYSWTEKEKTTRGEGREGATEKAEKMERGIEARVKEIIGVFEKQLEELARAMKEEIKREIKEERERREKEMDEERERREREREKEQWERGKKELVDRIRRLEEEREREEREKRRNNIVIKGVEWKEGDKEEAVKEFIRDKMGIETEVEKAHAIRVGDRKTIMVASMKSREEKIKIMKGKSKLAKGVYIDEDLTKKEREIQQQIRREARVRREKGGNVNVRIGYRKLKVGDRWYKWNEKEERLSEERRRG
ncbi:histone-lysine N-methyltransferase, H3 lysine-79 specific-like [Bombus pyrosoma]|uniref:histone-lysine N-methyltransferase, H3 lysine-79 specific-like n=1 Tax=Bombus pyrosoma TaxID=396416 RepID=UPI001CB8D0D5|nr:histone-lysine N-methyltransferase, H3 lysine-79 specific-like [Bombus pyrosoma]XP_043586625.1 histone-lysine N-methyltransferase, H3 lysine-79 specific-like [Bombus pyrosoma]